MTTNNINLEQTLLRILERLRSLEKAAKTVLNLDECAAYTGLAKSYLYKLTARCKIPHYKPSGKRIYFKRTEIDEWLLRNPVQTDEDIERAAEMYLRNNRD